MGISSILASSEDLNYSDTNSHTSCLLTLAPSLVLTFLRCLVTLSIARLWILSWDYLLWPSSRGLGWANRPSVHSSLLIILGVRSFPAHPKCFQTLRSLPRLLGSGTRLATTYRPTEAAERGGEGLYPSCPFCTQPIALSVPPDSIPPPDLPPLGLQTPGSCIHLRKSPFLCDFGYRCLLQNDPIYFLSFQESS